MLQLFVLTPGFSLFEDDGGTAFFGERGGGVCFNAGKTVASFLMVASNQ